MPGLLSFFCILIPHLVCYFPIFQSSRLVLSEFSIVIAVGTHISSLKSALTHCNEFCLILEICLGFNSSYLFIVLNSTALESCRTLDKIPYSTVLISSFIPGIPSSPPCVNVDGFYLTLSAVHKPLSIAASSETPVQV